MKDTTSPIAELSPHSTSGLLALFATTVFVSAFLLFQVQPMIGKYILPWFGSTPGVWTTALLFFQLMLLGGYIYAHFIVSRLTWRRQAILHATLLGLALVALPITPAEALKPTNAGASIGRILLILGLSVGAPYLMLSATGPLLQRWFAELHPSRSPYRLYALSNTGSLLALLSYPFMVERFVRLEAQTLFWSLGYIGFAALCGACAWKVFHLATAAVPQQGESEIEPSPTPVASSRSGHRPGLGPTLLWLSLSACGSALLLATTNQMSMDIAVIPFLWILPLGIYLLTFILCFEHERWYVRPLFVALLPLALMNALRLVYGGAGLGIVDQMVGYSLSLFICCMCCHGELFRMRPAPVQLTFFFLVASVGGALGSLFVAVVAPAIFSSFYEFHILLVACYVLVVLVQVRVLLHGESKLTRGRVAGVLSGVCWAAALCAIIIGSVFSVIPGTWFDDDASSNVTETFASWQAGVLMYVLVAAVLLLLFLEIWRRRREEAWRTWWASGGGIARLGLSATLAAGFLSLSGGLTWQVLEAERRVVERARNFYGTLAIKERDVGERMHRLSLTHGCISHGLQLQRYPAWPTSYFGPETGIGLAIQHHPERSREDRQFRIGVVGLGVGTLAAYANARVDPEQSRESYTTTHDVGIADYIGFYELNPLVVRWARDRFTFLADASERGADLAIFEGDGRITLEHQLELGQEQRFDVLAIDAFSSDAIPIHLMTYESFQIYLRHLNEDGILAIHVTNRFVDLIPITQRLAEAIGLKAIYVENYERSNRMVDSSDWILLTTNQAFLDLEVVHEDEVEMPEAGPLWTDDFSSVFEAVEFDN